MFHRPVLVAVALLAALLPAAAITPVTSTYEVRWIGIRIATARITSALDENAYALVLDSNYGVALSRGSVSGRVTGFVRGNRIFPQSYELGASGSPEQRASMRFADNAAQNVQIVPPLPPDWNDGRIPLQPDHRRNVVDPLSGLVLAALRAGGEPADACRTTVPVFTGVSRLDIVLSPAPPEARPRGEARRSDAPAIRCAVRFVPIAGHRPVNQTVRALQASTTMRIDFEAERTGIARMPRRIEIPTRYGTVLITRQDPARP